ncbi:MAG: DUF4286 family protein [Muribaculaceae bacterium]|nr:DUF4286 family protein [Muribaculaceae bacterium]
MILLNTTFSVDDSIVLPFIDFIRDVYVSLAESSGMHSCLLSELRVPQERNALTDANTRTFALQMRAPSDAAVEEFRTDILPEIYRLMGSRWGMGVAMFESTLDVIHDSSAK